VKYTDDVANDRGRQPRAWLSASRWWLGALLLVASGPPSGFADLDIQARNGLLTLRARAVPLTDVLQSLSRETGLKVVYEGPRPSHLVTASIVDLPEVEAVSQLFEGLGVNYAYKADTSGKRVELLIVSGTTTSGTTTSGLSEPPQGRSQAPSFRAPAMETPEPESPAGDDQGDSPEPPEVDPAASPGLGGRVPPLPLPNPGSSSGSGEVAPPAFPSQASNPVPPAFFPPGASYPTRDQPPF